MPSTNFAPGTIIGSTWLNEINQLRFDADGARWASMTPGLLGSVARSVQAKLRDVVSVKDFGAVGDGSTNDTAALQAALTQATASGLAVYMPPGSYNITSTLTLSSGANPFVLFGDGPEVCRIVRSSDAMGSAIQITATDGFTLRGFSINCNHALYPNGNHGISFQRSNNVLIERVKVYNYKNTGIIAATPDDGLQKSNVWFVQCEVDGLNAANNGILMSTLVKSGMVDCRALNIGKNGSPGYGLQLKNECYQCVILGGQVSGAISGIALANDTSTPSVTNSIISNVAVYNCTRGIQIGQAADNLFEGIVIDMNLQGTTGVQVGQSSNSNVFRGIAVRGVAAAGKVATFTTSNENDMEIAQFDNTAPTATSWFTCDSASFRNRIHLSSVSPANSIPPVTGDVISGNGKPATMMTIEGVPMVESLTIGSTSEAVNTMPSTDLVLLTPASGTTDTLKFITTSGEYRDGKMLTIRPALDTYTISTLQNQGTNGLRMMGTYSLTGREELLTLQYSLGLQRWLGVAYANNL